MSAPFSLASLSRTLLAACIVLAAGTSLTAHAGEAWPDKPVRIIVPFTAGGSADTASRIVGQGLGALWHQSVVIDSHPGAAGAIGADLTAHAPADGYTLLMASGSMFTVNPYVYKHLPYSMKDFSFVTTVVKNPMVVVVAPTVPAKTLKELIALAKAKPGELNFGSAGYGSQVHMAGEALADTAGINIRHVPYKGEMLAYNDLMAGRMQIVVGNIGVLTPFIKSGKVRALAVTSETRSAALPEVPTATEAGLKGFDVTGWFGLVAPAGTPPAVLAKVQRDVAAVLAQPQTRQRLAAIGEIPVGDTSAQMKNEVVTEMQQWQGVVKSRHIAAH